ncbi:MAG: acetate/propionate family kinase [Acetobacteraceae bacterium]|nr:acetate/propionate family kinase [Acetobacteraceae bacterium]
MSGCVLVLNGGSSSLKFAAYALPLDEAGPLLRGQVEGIGAEPHLLLRDGGGAVLEERRFPAEGFDHRAAVLHLQEGLRGHLGDNRVVAIGHRVVHGGDRPAAAERVDAALLAALSALEPLAPLHQPHNLAPIRAIAELAPALPQVACYDTAFHRSQPPLARSFALPRALTAEGVRRYGFHGLSYEFIADRLAELDPALAAGRVIAAHLGNGASLCAMQGGRSVASTMGFTAADGLMMGTRCGALDPGVLIYLMDRHGLGARELEDLIYRRSGLLGVSGLSQDMRRLRAAGTPEAAEAIALYVYRIVREVGSLAAALGGLDGIVFTAGIGENDAATREAVCDGCRWLGLELDPACNRSGGPRINADGSRVAAWVIPTDEERMIARHTLRVLGLG